MPALSDDALRALIRTDSPLGWRTFIDQYTPLLVGSIRRAGVVDRDEVMEIYVAVCEQLSARGFERLKSQDAARGSIGGWLAVVARHAVVDWVRSRRGRRRLFHAVQDLPAFEQQVFELYYWEERTPSEIAELLSSRTGSRVDLVGVLEALERVDRTLSDRHRAELLALAVRSRTPSAIDDTDAAHHVADPQPDPETTVRVAELNGRLERALGVLSPEDAAIVRLKYAEGLSTRDVEHALGITGLTSDRLRAILARLRAALAAAGINRIDGAAGGVSAFGARP